MSTDTAKEQVAKMLELGYRLLRGGQDPLQVAREILDMSLAFAPVEVLAPMLSDVAKKRAEAIADLAETAKFGPG